MENFNAAFYTAVVFVSDVAAVMLGVVIIAEILGFFISKALDTAIKTTTTKKTNENDPL